MTTTDESDYTTDLFGSGGPASSGQKYYGKYRGTVVNNVDPLLIGRIQAFVPDVAAVLPSSWAMPCVPIAGIQSGAWMVPALGSDVWIEFEQGDPDFPIWVGGFWGSPAHVPALAQAGVPGSPSIVLQTLTQNMLMISDAPGPAGGILLQCKLASISVSEAGIIIQNGQGASITLTGPTVAVNLGALVVT
jgi:hypothetical protein